MKASETIRSSFFSSQGPCFFVCVSFFHTTLLIHIRCTACTGGSVASYLTKCTKDLMDLTDLVRGNLSYQDRTTLGALITVDVHARDVVQELSDAGV